MSDRVELSLEEQEALWNFAERFSEIVMEALGVPWWERVGGR